MLVASSDGGEVFRRTWAAEFSEEVVLLQRDPTPQKIEQEIFHVFTSFELRDLIMLKLAKISHQGAWRNIQFQHGFRTTTQETDQIPYLRALFGGAGRELHAHAVSRMRDAHHAFGMHLHLFGFQAQIDQRSLGK